MLRNHPPDTCPEPTIRILNEVLSLNAQESGVPDALVDEARELPQ